MGPDTSFFYFFCTFNVCSDKTWVFGHAMGLNYSALPECFRFRYLNLKGLLLIIKPGMQYEGFNSRYICAMRKWILYVLLLSFTPSAFAQSYKAFKGDTINRTDAAGKKQGLWKKYYPGDTLFSEGSYKNDVPTGTFRTYYKNGHKQAVIKYRGATGEGVATVFSDTGSIMAQGKYLFQKKDSTWIYFGGNGQKSAEERYKNGVKEGMWKIYYPNGKISRIVNYKADKKTGSYIEYFENGVTKLEATMKNDDFEGLFTIYHPNGKVWQQGGYKNGLKEGIWTTYTDTGAKEKEEKFIGGVNPEEKPGEQ